MRYRLWFLLFSCFLFHFALLAQPGDSIGTLYVKKKKDTLANNANVFLLTESMPAFPVNGGEGMEEFIHRNFKVPKEAFNKGISGTVIVQVLVDKNGNLTQPGVTRGIDGCKPCDAEALRVVKLMPAWIPAYQDGKPVPVRMSIPVKFRFRE
jgi:TonB family protein